ncbi:hypothetical protein Ct9H90mP29_00960 [bacterium]|nr:MAG: hypothetical protein Ct9H90mP29_00960 [bacterium]
MTMLENVAKEQKPLIGKSMEDLEAFSQSLGQELFRGDNYLIGSIEKMYTIFLKCQTCHIHSERNYLGYHSSFENGQRSCSNSKQTQKFLFELESGEFIESVL